MSLVTRCPVCATAFRVQRAQLAARGGKVRCGKCGQIFDGIAALVEEGGAEPTAAEPSPQLGLFDASRRASVVDEDAPLPTFMAEDEPARKMTLLWSVVAFVALLVLGAQIVHRNRSELAARFPGLRDPLAAACRPIRCQVLLPRSADDVKIESSDLQADGRRDSVYVLNALLKNQAASAQEYPALELTLTDESARPVLRRVLMPGDYVDAGRALEQGIASGAEIPLRLYLDTGRVRAVGYRLYLFYP